MSAVFYYFVRRLRRWLILSCSTLFLVVSDKLHRNCHKLVINQHFVLRFDDDGVYVQSCAAEGGVFTGIGSLRYSCVRIFALICYILYIISISVL